MVRECHTVLWHIAASKIALLEHLSEVAAARVREELKKALHYLDFVALGDVDVGTCTVLIAEAHLK
jgi:hypothetical protein